MLKRSLAAVCLFAMPFITLAPSMSAADHRDAPGVDGAGEGDITDVFAFLDPGNASRMVLAMGVNPFAVPGAAPSYRFSSEYLYQFKIDRSGTYTEDLVFQIRFENTATGQKAFVSVGNPGSNVGAVNQLLISPNSSVNGTVERNLR